MHEGIDNVGVAVADLDAALAFYETLGFECEPYSDVDAQVAPGDGAYLYVFETEGGAGVERGGDLFENPVGIDHVSVRVDDVDETCESLSAAGVEFFLAPTTEAEWGLRMAGTRDPSGNVVYFVTDA
ncbi:MAG: VOC family protein [Haloarculaceae archaeon]